MARSEFPPMRIRRSRLGITSLVLLTLVRDALLQTPLRREDVAEGSCILPYPAASLPAPTFFLQTTLGRRTPYFVPMGSQHLYRSYATYLLGRPPNSQQELESMNLRIRGFPVNWWHTTGYTDHFIDQLCIPQGSLFRANCIATRGSDVADLDSIRQTTDTLVYTDNRSVLLVVRCVMGRENDWKVLSTKPKVDPEVKAKILEKVMELGFKNSSHWMELQYNGSGR